MRGWKTSVYCPISSTASKEFFRMIIEKPLLLLIPLCNYQTIDRYHLFPEKIRKALCA